MVEWGSLAELAVKSMTKEITPSKVAQAQGGAVTINILLITSQSNQSRMVMFKMMITLDMVEKRMKVRMVRVLTWTACKHMRARSVLDSIKRIKMITTVAKSSSF